MIYILNPSFIKTFVSTSYSCTCFFSFCSETIATSNFKRKKNRLQEIVYLISSHLVYFSESDLAQWMVHVATFSFQIPLLLISLLCVVDGYTLNCQLCCYIMKCDNEFLWFIMSKKLVHWNILCLNLKLFYFFTWICKFNSLSI